ncbi:MAG: DUF2267 domain-containing protein [Coleofasciculus sp. S288]|nr:DUF2267 domain-containing protein [Coleofasciculus sp. S288]
MKTDTSFLDKVQLNGHLENINKAKDVTEVVFRAMRDLMTTEAADRVDAELRRRDTHKNLVPTAPEVPTREIADLWKDTNPVAGFLSRLDAPLQVDADTFLYMIRQETDLPEGVSPETVVQAIFCATKQELSPERVEEIASFLPGKIQQMWQQA